MSYNGRYKHIYRQGWDDGMKRATSLFLKRLNDGWVFAPFGEEIAVKTPLSSGIALIRSLEELKPYES